MLYRGSFLHADAGAQIAAINRLMTYVVSKGYCKLKAIQRRAAAYEQIDVTVYKSICLAEFKKQMAEKRAYVEDKVT